MRRTVISIFLTWCILAVSGPALGFPSAFQRVDPFYVKLFEEGKQLWSQGLFTEAIQDLEIAYFGFLKSPEPLLEASIYLMVCHFEVGSRDRAAFFRARLIDLGAEDKLSGLDLPQALLEKYHEASAYFERQRMAGQPDPSAVQDKSPLMSEEAVTPPQKSPFSRIAELERLIERDRNNFGAYLEIASLYIQHDNAGRAEPVLEKLLQLDPENSAGRFMLGRVYLIQKKFREAAAEFEKALPALDGDIEFHYQWGIALYNLRDFEGAGREFEKVRSMNAGYKLSEEYMEEIARLSEPETTPEEPETAPEEPAGGQPETPPESSAEPDYLEMARKEGRLKKKIQYYIEALKQDPSQIDIYFEMTGAYRTEKKYRQGIDLLIYLMEYIPNDLRIYTGLADLYILRKSFQDAIDICSQGLALDPGNLDLTYHLGRAYMGKKRYDEAAAEFRKILEESPEFRDVPDLLETCLEKMEKNSYHRMDPFIQ